MIINCRVTKDAISCVTSPPPGNSNRINNSARICQICQFYCFQFEPKGDWPHDLLYLRQTIIPWRQSIFFFNMQIYVNFEINKHLLASE